MVKKELALLSRLSNGFGPSGQEDEIRNLIIDQIKPYVDTLKIDGIGNLIATKGNCESLLILAHMDEVGFMVTSMEGNGHLRFRPVGGIDPKHLPSKRVRFSNSNVVGIIGAKPIHLTKGGKEALSYKDLYIDIGTSSFEESQKFVSIGDCAVFDTEFSTLNDMNSILKGKAFDNRLGCFLLCKLLSNNAIKNGTFVFTVQEETGLSGATTLLKKYHFPVGIAIDTTTANDLYGVLPHRTVCSMNCGAVISYADGATIYNRDLIRDIFQHLEKNKIKCQTKTRRTGGNEASVIEKIGNGAKAISVSVPCRYIHGPVGIVSIRDIELTEKALINIVSFLEGAAYDQSIDNAF